MLREKQSSAFARFLSEQLTFKGAVLSVFIMVLLISGPAICFFLSFRTWQRKVLYSPEYQVRNIIQTGPQKKALSTEYLAELLDLSVSHPVSIHRIDTACATKKLLSSPLIAEGKVSTRRPCSLYIDYTVRKPIAFLADYENVALDEQGYIFPVKPFLSPKNLPEIYLGLPPFGKESENSNLCKACWEKPLSGPATELALRILKTIDSHCEAFNVKRLDLSKAFAASCGEREIVLETQDKIDARIYPRILRLTPQDYPQQLGNYIELRKKLLAQESATLVSLPVIEGVEKPLIIDLRLPQLAFLNKDP